MYQPKRRRVALLVEVDDSFGQAFVRGVTEYRDRSAPWALLVAPCDHQGRLRLPDRWKGDGVIARLSDAAMAEHVHAARLPTVDIETIVPDNRWAGRVFSDDVKRARFAVDHFRERGFRRFAYFGPPSRRYSSLRGRLFAAEVGAAGFRCAIYTPGYRTTRRIDWTRQERLASQWLASLDKPVAVFTADGFCGRLLTEICEASGVTVPEDVAIVAGDNDELMCGVLRPTLSGVVLGCRHIGYESAALLERLMRGEPVPKDPILIEPLGVIARESSDILAFDDPDLTDAIRFIRSRASEGINVSDVLREVPISRRKLELRFHEHFGCSPAEEIRRVRLNQARQLLADSDKTIAEVADACGFANASRLCIAFRKRFGMTPLAFRHQAQA
jgi:LacI family transcriptional regulator